MTGRAPDLATTRDLARAYRRCGEVDAASSALYQRVAVALSESDAALRVLAVTPARSRRPALILAALHDLAGRAPSLAAACAAYAGGDAGAAAIEVLVTQADAVLHLAGRRRTRVVGTTRCAVLYPAVTEAARRACAGAVGLVGVGASLGLDLHVESQRTARSANIDGVRRSSWPERPHPARASASCRRRPGCSTDTGCARSA